MMRGVMEYRVVDPTAGSRRYRANADDVTYISEKAASEAVFESENPRQKSGRVRALQCQLCGRCYSTKCPRFCCGGASGQLHQTMPSGPEDSLSLFEVNRTGRSDNHGFGSIQQIAQTRGAIWNPCACANALAYWIRTKYHTNVRTPAVQSFHVNCGHRSVPDNADSHAKPYQARVRDRASLFFEVGPQPDFLLRIQRIERIARVPAFQSPECSESIDTSPDH